MAEGYFVAYYRVSTQRQGQSGLGLEAQRKAVHDYLNGGSWELVDTFTEVESGKKSNRKELALALATCRRHGAKLIIAKIDRLARNVEFVANLMNSGVEFVAVDMPEANRLTVHIMAAMAEHEREMISARTKAGLAAAKARGTRLGNPNWQGAVARSVEVRQANADAFNEYISPIVAQIRKCGVTTLSGIAEALNARGVPTARAWRSDAQGPRSVWQAVSVKRVLDRAKRRASS
jgi:DNA invertase Pin-like site-specific DNA recombinase